MRMICRECKRIMSLTELGTYACGYFAKLVFSYGLASYIAQAIKDYFSDPKRDFIDESMAGSCNGLQIPCPQCQKVAWNPFPWQEEQQITEEKQGTTIKQQQQDESKKDETITAEAAKQEILMPTIEAKENTAGGN